MKFQGKSVPKYLVEAGYATIQYEDGSTYGRFENSNTIGLSNKAMEKKLDSAAESGRINK